MLNNFKLLLVCYIMLICFARGCNQEKGNHSLELEVGDNCPFIDREGTCTLITDCPEVYNTVRSSGTHNYTRCGFADLIEIVCCPKSISGEEGGSSGGEGGSSEGERGSTGGDGVSSGGEGGSSGGGGGSTGGEGGSSGDVRGYSGGEGESLGEGGSSGGEASSTSNTQIINSSLCSKVDNNELDSTSLTEASPGKECAEKNEPENT